jgi:hypothetical protein
VVRERALVALVKDLATTAKEKASLGRATAK